VRAVRGKRHKHAPLYNVRASSELIFGAPLVGLAACPPFPAWGDAAALTFLDAFRITDAFLLATEGLERGEGPTMDGFLETNCVDAVPWQTGLVVLTAHNIADYK